MEGSDIRDEVYRGIIPRTVEALFAGVSEADENIEFTFKVSYVEIYMEKIRDLLDEHRVKVNLAIREDKGKGIYIAGVTEEYVTSHEELLNIMALGAENRATAATGMNEGSSRSHSVFTITVSQRDTSNATSKSGKLVLVDLAGSEMVRKTNASGQQLEEAKTINKSLSALGQVIMALTDEKASHVPYRDSKLTRVLQDSLGGNSKTVLIVACSPSSFNANETISTLRFGTRAKSIENKVTVNQVRSIEELEDLLSKAERALDAQQAHIVSLTAQLASKDPSSGSGDGGGGADSALIDQLKDTIERLSQQLEEEREDSSRTRAEAEKLASLVDEKQRLLMEAGEILIEAERRLESQTERADTYQKELVSLQGESEGWKTQTQTVLEKLYFDLEELKATNERLVGENERMTTELSQLSGDVTSKGGVERRGSLMEAGVAVDMQENNAPSGSEAAIPVKDVSGKEVDGSSSVGSVELLDIEGRHAAANDSRNLLHELFHRIGVSSDVYKAVFEWVDKAFDEQERWFKKAIEKFGGYEKALGESAKKLKEVEIQRTRLEKDLSSRAEKVGWRQGTARSLCSILLIVFL